MSDGQRYLVVNNLLVRLAGDLGTNLWNLDSLWHFYLKERPKDVGKMVRADLKAQEAEEEYIEGKKGQRYTNYFERNPRLVAKAKKLHGVNCSVCGFNFEVAYGEHGIGYIEAHHLRPVSSFGKATKVDPKTEMTVVCANCHRMLHRKKEVLSPEELRKMFQESS